MNRHRVAILTDASAQFTVPDFPGRELVHVIPLRIQWGRSGPLTSQPPLTEMPQSARNGFRPRLISPSPAEFRQAFLMLRQQYHELVVVLQSARLCAAFAHAREAATLMNGHASVHVLDSQTTSVGLGMLVQRAAELAMQGARASEVIRELRGMITEVDTVFFVQGLTYLEHAGHLDHGQAIVGEMLGVTPFLLLENGRLVPITKVRNMRHLVDTLYEFLSEFLHVRHIALLQGHPPFVHEARILRERIGEDFPDAPFTEHPLSPTLATLIGPRSLGVVVLE